jgi:hypothetical protein
VKAELRPECWARIGRSHSSIRIALVGYVIVLLISPEFSNGPDRDVGSKQIAAAGHSVGTITGLQEIRTMLWVHQIGRE